MSETTNKEKTYTLNLDDYEKAQLKTLKYESIMLSESPEGGSITFLLNGKGYKCVTVESIEGLVELLKTQENFLAATVEIKLQLSKIEKNFMKKYKFWKLASHLMFVILIMVMVYPIIEIFHSLVK